MKEAAEFLDRDKHLLIEQWEKRARQNIVASGETQSLSLRDHVPELLEDIIEVMRRTRKEEVRESVFYEELIANSKEHGRHRATSFGYNIDQILREFILFHQIIIDRMQKEGYYSEEVGIVLQFTVENSMLYSAKAFNEALIEMRQKLMGVLAHDMRNPLAVAKVALDIMELEKDPEKLAKTKRMGRNSLDRVLKMLENLLDTVSIRAGEGITLNFSQVGLMEEIDSLYREAEEIYSNEIKLEAPGGALEGTFDGTMLRRALENLMSNAVKYGGRNTPITLKVEDLGEQVRISVHNEGNPIPEEKQRQIFEFLSTTNTHGMEDSKSWGMGLPLVVAVAQAHGGNLTVSSSEKDGTVFSLSIMKYIHDPGMKRVSLNFDRG